LAERTVSSAAAASEHALLQRWSRAPEFGEAPRVLAVVAHPDDEVLGLGGRLRHVGSQLDVAYVSDGAPDNEDFFRPLGFERRDQYAAARREEARRALMLAGVTKDRAHALGVTDQRVTPALERVVDWVLGLIVRLEPEGLITHAYEGGHPDHDATACAVHVALERLRRGPGRPPSLWEFASYHLQGTELIRGRFIPDAAAAEERITLNEAARALKLSLLECHATQRAFLSTFPVDAEHFRLAPRYDFSRPPAAPFFYDRVRWGVSGAAFLGAACQLLQAHDIAGPC
jgi:LmbE family N-acetylglucosaminyl deacetylase